MIALGRLVNGGEEPPSVAVKTGLDTLELRRNILYFVFRIKLINPTTGARQ